jgi:signal transduction histidine kinase
MVLFVLFEQENYFYSNINHGNGMGLTIVKYLVERQGGQIWLESELGRFSKFFIALPR